MTDHDSPPAAPKPPHGAPKQVKSTPENQRCHYVPQFLLRNFAQKCGRVLLLNKNTGEIRCESPKTICQVTNLYKTHTLDANMEPIGAASFWAEKVLSKFENKVAPAIKKTIQQIQEGNNLTLNATERKRVISFLCMLPLQSLPYHSIASEAAGKPDIHEAYKDLLADGDEVSVPDKVREFTKAYSATRLTRLQNIANAFPNHGLRILRISFTEMFFVTGSIPFVWVHENRGLGAWIPISPKIAVSFANQRTDCVFPPSRDRIRAMNRYMYDLLDEIAVHSREHAEEVAQTRKSQIQRLSAAIHCISIKS